MQYLRSSVQQPRSLICVEPPRATALVSSGLTADQNSPIATVLSSAARSPKRNPEHRHLVQFNADNSLSMQGAPISQLNTALKEFAKQIASDRVIRGSVLIGLAGFGSGAHALDVLVPFSPPDAFHPPALVAHTGTPHCRRVVESIELLTVINEDIQRVFDCDTRHAWLFDMTDGQAMDRDHHAAAINASRSARNVECFYFGVGDHVDMDYLRSLEQPRRPAQHIRDAGDLRQFFGWLHHSLHIASQSVLGETLRLNGFGDGDEECEVRA